MEKLKYGSDYLSSKQSYPFPSEDISQNQKRDNGYFLGCCNAIVSKFVNNKCAVPYDAPEGYRTFQELRAYRNGTNSPNKYKNFIAGLPDKQTGKRKSTLNISWEVLKILAQKMDVVKGYLQKINYDITTNAIDYNALISKKTKVSMAKLLADQRLKQMVNEVNAIAGTPVIQPQEASEMPGGMEFQNPQDVDVAAQVGVFFLEQEAALQNLLIKTKDESRIDGITDLWSEDLMTCGYAGSFVTTNPNTSMVTIDYVDVDRAIWPYSTYDDYRDISWAGHVRKISIAQLRKESNLSDIQIVEIARKYSTDSYGNTVTGFYSAVSSYNSQSNFGINMIDQIMVDIVDCRWYGQKNVNMTTVLREKEKNLAVNTVDDDYKLTEKQKKQGKDLYKYKNQTIYKAKVVLGTSYVFDCGEDSDITYKKDINGNMWPVFPYRFSRCLSLVERCIGFVDDANLANLKLRVARRKMPAPPNIQIDKSALEGMQIGGQKFKPLELMQLLQDEGVLITDSKNQWGNQTSQGAAIRPIATDVINQLTAWWEDMGRCIDMIEKVTGINDVFSAQTPQRETGLGVSNLLVQGTQNALTPLVKAREYLYESSVQCAGKKWQIVSTYMPDDQRKRLSINRSLEVVRVGSDLNEYDFDIRVQVSHNEGQIDQLIAEITQMKSAARQGGIQTMSEADFILVESMLRAGNLNQAKLYMANAVERRQKEAKEEQMSMIQANGQQQQQSAAQKGKIDQQIIQTEAQVQSGLEQQKSQSDFQNQYRLELLKGQNERQKAILENQLGGRKSA